LSGASCRQISGLKLLFGVRLFNFATGGYECQLKALQIEGIKSCFRIVLDRFQMLVGFDIPAQVVLAAASWVSSSGAFL
jgi:hypothetical protein